MSEIACPTCGTTLIYEPYQHGYRCPDEDGCGFHATFTESGRGSVLWSIRLTPSRSSPQQLARVIYDVEKSVRKGVKQPRPSSIKGQREHTPTERLALKHGLEPEDVFSIRKSSERTNELAKFYGIHVRAVQEIKKADL